MRDKDRPILARTAIGSASHFGTVLRAARTTSGVSGTELAGRLGVSPSTISQRETSARGVHVGAAIDQLWALGYRLVVEPMAPYDAAKAAAESPAEAAARAAGFGG